MRGLHLLHDLRYYDWDEPYEWSMWAVLKRSVGVTNEHGWCILE